MRNRNRFNRKRKRNLIAAAVVTFAFVLSAATAGLTTSSWWTGDGTTNDLISLNDAQLQGGASYATGIHSKAFLLSQDDSVIKLPSAAADGLEDFTFEGWIYTEVDSGTVISGAKSNTDVNELGVGINLNSMTISLKGSQASFSWPEALVRGTFYHIAWVRENSGTNRVFLNSVEFGSTNLPTGALDIAENGLWLGQKQSAIGTFVSGVNFLGRLDEIALHNDSLTQGEVNRRYRLTRRLKSLERDGLRTNLLSNKLDETEALVNARLDALETQISANQSTLEDLLGELEALVEDTHLLDPLDMEISACLNLGGGAALALEPHGEAESEILGTVGVDAYGNGALFEPATNAGLDFSFEAGAEVGIEASACLGGFTVRQNDVVGAAAELRDAVVSMAQALSIPVNASSSLDNIKTAITEVQNVSISTDPTSLLSGPPDIIDSLPLPGNVKTVFDDIQSIIPSDLSEVTPNCSSLSGAFASIAGSICGQANDPLTTLNSIKSIVDSVKTTVDANLDQAVSVVSGAVTAVQITAGQIKSETDKIGSIKSETDKIGGIKSQTDKIGGIKTTVDKICRKTQGC